jgi:hypothetical protein
VKAVRFAAAIICISAVLAMPAMALAGSTTSTTIYVGGKTTTVSQITPTAPSRLSSTTSSTSTTGSSGGTLPNTGLDLFPETLLGFALVMLGVGLRYRRFRA